MPKSTDESKSLGEPWRCDNCRALIYNLDENGRPAPGAPKPMWLDHEYQNVCLTCFQIGVVVRDSTYFKAQHDRHYERLKKALGGETA